eukprot:1824317-Amphidinium_carterae.1
MSGLRVCVRTCICTRNLRQPERFDDWLLMFVQGLACAKTPFVTCTWGVLGQSRKQWDHSTLERDFEKKAKLMSAVVACAMQRGKNGSERCK